MVRTQIRQGTDGAATRFPATHGRGKAWQGSRTAPGGAVSPSRAWRGPLARSSSALMGACLLLGATGANATMIGPLDLGEAGDLGLAFYALSGTLQATSPSTVIAGNLGLGDGGLAAQLQRPFTASYAGTFYADPLANLNISTPTPPAPPNLVFQDLSGAAATLRASALSAAGLAPTQTFGDIDLGGANSQRITATGAVNVIQADVIDLGGSATLVLEGGSDQVFIINTESLSLRGSSKILLEGGLTPDKVLFNAQTSVETSGSTFLNGYVFCLASFTCNTEIESTLNGAVFSESLRVSSGAQINFVPVVPPAPQPSDIPEPAALALLGFGLLGLSAGLRRRP